MCVSFISFHCKGFSTSTATSRNFVTLHVRLVSHIFNRTSCIYQTATQRHVPPYQIAIQLIDEIMLIFVCLLDDLILGFLLNQFNK